MNIYDFVIMSLIKKLFNTETFKEAGTGFWKKLHIMCLKTVIFIAFCFLVIVNATEMASSSVHVFQEPLEVKYERLLAKFQKNRETLTNALKYVDRKKRSVPSKYHFFFTFFFLKCPWNISVLVLIYVYSKIKIYL